MTQPEAEQPVVDVCVVGGGLAGLAFAVACAKLRHNLSWTLCEAADELRTATGTLIGLGSNGMHALECIDPRIAEGIRAASQLSTFTEVHTRPLDPADPSAEVRKQAMVCPLHTIRWAATQSVLADLVDHSKVRCGHKCTGWTQDEADGLITVHFKGRPDIKARLVVGADGVRSGVRGSMFPDDPGPRYLGYMNWNAVRHVPGSGSQPHANTIKVTFDQRGRFNTFVYNIAAGNDWVFWQVRMPFDDAPAFTNGTHGGAGVPGSKARVMERLREHGWDDALAEVEATDESAIFERALWDRLPLDSWSTPDGRVLLLGDAAHAMYPGPGMGARTAFEDAHQLMLAVDQHWPDAAALARHYEDARVLRASIIQNYAAAMANIGGLSKDFNDFWLQHQAEGESLHAQQQERFKEFNLWVNSYPDHKHGLESSRFTRPDVLRAFAAHCAALSAAAAKQQQPVQPAPGNSQAIAV